MDVRSLVGGAVARVEIDVGPGRGGFVLERLAARADVGVVGLEIRRKWAQIVDDRIRRAGFGGRGRVFSEDAPWALRRLGPAGSVAAVFVHFPDPWWKKRHRKRSVVGTALLGEIARLLSPGGELFVQTDVEERAVEYAAQVGAHGAFEPAGEPAGSPVVPDNPYGARSTRERRAMRDGLPVWRMRWVRRP